MKNRPIETWTPWADEPEHLPDRVVWLRAQRDRMAWQLARPIPCPCRGDAAPSRKHYRLETRFTVQGPPHAGEARWICCNCQSLRPLQRV